MTASTNAIMAAKASEDSTSARPEVPNGSPAEQEINNNTVRRPKNDAKNAARGRGKRLNEIHSRPLPLAIHPLPAFHPTNPLSLLHLAYTFLSQLLTPVSSHSQRFIGYLSLETRSVHVTDEKQVRALWEMGFFGKGLLSRSEPTWLSAIQQSGATAEEHRAGVREQRRAFKLERAREQREKIEKQKAIEEGRLDASLLDPIPEVAESGEDRPLLDSQSSDQITTTSVAKSLSTLSTPADTGSETPRTAPLTQTVSNANSSRASKQTPTAADQENLSTLEVNQEHLQLAFEETFFLVYALGVLEIVDGPQSWEAASKRKPGSSPESVLALLQCFCNRSYFPPRDPSYTPKPDDQFLLNYVTYHHFRSLGWVPRPGVKFAVDYLIYNRGPPFSHAEFGIIIVPSYSAPYWNSEHGKRQRRVREVKDWRWLHCINRVQTAVIKTLVLCYVEVPPPDLIDPGDIGRTLRAYKVREFAIQRWSGNRARG